MNKKHFLWLTTSAIVVSYSASSIPSLSAIANGTNVYATKAVMFDTSSPANFIKSMAPHAKKLGQEKDLYASIMIAQAALESGYGKSTLTRDSNNLFGVKEKNGGTSINVPSKEFDESGKEIIIVSPFKVFESHLHSLEYYTTHFTQSPWYTNYYKGIHRSESYSYKEALQVLNGRYATDPLYVQKLQKLIDQYNLTQYDAPSGLKAPVIAEPKPSNNEAKNPLVTAPKDTTALREVSALKASVTVSQASLTFVQPKDADFSHVVIFRDGSIIASKHTTTSYVDQGLKENTKYTYTVKTIDKQGNQSKGITITTTTSKKSVVVTATYTVKKGDTLSKIARENSVSVQNLKAWNNLKTDVIKVGQRLQLKGATATITTPSATTTAKKTAKITVSSLNMRSGAGTNFKKVATIKKNETVTVNSVLGKWAYVTYGSKKGYVHTDYIKISTTISTSTPATSNTVSKTATATHIVKKGDTLISIGKKYGVSVATLKSWNKMNANTIYVGQKLTVSK